MRNRINVIATAAALAGTAAILAPNMSAAASPASSSLPRLTLALTSNSLTVGGKLQSGAVKVIMNVTGQRHTEPVLFRLKPGVPFSAFPRAVAAVAAHNGDLNYLDPYGSIVFDAVANKGTSGAQTALRQGNYIAIDLASTKANPPHAAFTITRAAHPAKLPKPGATISAIDFTFHGRHQAPRMRTRALSEQRLPGPPDPRDRRQERKSRQAAHRAAARRQGSPS